jgi:hypothetical protein
VVSFLAPCTEREGTLVRAMARRDSVHLIVSVREAGEFRGGTISWRRSSEMSGRKANDARQLNNGG